MDEIKFELDPVPVNRFRNNNALDNDLDNASDDVIEIESLLGSQSMPGPSSARSSGPLVPTARPTARPTAEIEQKHTYEDIEMTYSRLPMPFNTTSQCILKRQNDIFSGNLPFNVTVGDYLSKIYNFLMKIHFILEKNAHI